MRPPRLKIAASMVMISGIVAKRVRKPTISKAPQTTSINPASGASNPGAGIPSLAKRPGPISMGKRNFWMPSKRKTPPTANRINKTDEGDLLLIVVILLDVGFIQGAIRPLGRDRQ